MVIRVEDFNRLMYGEPNPQMTRANAPAPRAAAAPTQAAAPAQAPAAQQGRTYSQEELANLLRLSRREMADMHRKSRKRFWKRFAIFAAVLGVFGWFINRNIRQNGDNTEERRPGLRQRLFAAQNYGQDYYEDEDYDFGAEEMTTPRRPVYHKKAPAVEFEIPVDVNYPVSSPIKQEYHELNAGTRDVVRDATATAGSGADLLYTVSDGLSALGSVQNAHYRTAAERERLKRQKETDKARTERERLRTERAKISNEQARQSMRLKEKRAREQAEARARKNAEQKAAAAAKKAEQQRKANERAAERERKRAEAAAKKAQAEAKKAAAEAQKKAAEFKRSRGK